MRLLTELAYGLLGAHRVVLRIAPDNVPSAAVAVAAGFHLADLPPMVLEDADGTRVVLRIWEHLRLAAD